jgi:hypothetical protein
VPERWYLDVGLFAAVVFLVSIWIDRSLDPIQVGLVVLATAAYAGLRMWEYRRAQRE